LLLAELNAANKIDWSRALIDGSFAKAPEGGEATGPNPTDRSKSGSKHHVLTDAQGIPLNATVTAANVNEVTVALHVLTEKARRGRQARTQEELPDRLQGDRAYDSEPLRVVLRWLGVTPVLAERNTDHGSGLGKFRWFAERTISWLHSSERLRRRLDRLTEIQEAFLRLGCAVVCIRVLTA
jgi:transposase